MITQKNLVSTCIAFVLCLFMFSCQKDAAVTADLAPVENTTINDISTMEVEERGGVLKALIVARRDDNKLKDTYYKTIFRDNPTCQVICYDADNKVYFGLNTKVPIRATTISGIACDNRPCKPNGIVVVVMQPNGMYYRFIEWMMAAISWN